MSEKDVIVNRVANSPLVTFDLEEYYHPGERVLLDIAEQLYKGLILREKDFRAWVKDTDWSVYKDKNVAVWCSVDAIIPAWAYMLLTTRISPFAHTVVFGTLEDLEKAIYQDALNSVDIEKFRDKKIVIKGCGKYQVPESAYVEITRLLTPVASSIMYGEACSTVPIYKKPKL
jgi:hypothetical protein